MATVYFEGKAYPLQETETVLEGLLRHQVDYPHACKAGTCQSCLSRTDATAADPAWQIGIKPTLAEQGYFLPCIAKPKTDISLFLPKAETVTFPAEIHKIFQLNHNVLCVRLTVNDLAPWTPGRYLNLINPNGDIRSYSIANLPCQDGYIELHVKLMPAGKMSVWLSTYAQAGAKVGIRGPLGECFYSNSDKGSFPIVLAGTGTGLAPLIAIAQDAISQQHAGDIHLIHGGVTAADLYLDKTLTRLAGYFPNFHYTKCTLTPSDTCPQMPIDQLLVDVLTKVTKPRLYVCGPEATTKKLKMKAFLAGVSSGSIYSDAFILAPAA